MKRCPKCNRTFPDDNQKFCTVDGGLLALADKPFDPNATIQGSANMGVPVGPPGETPASNRPPDLNETIAASAPTVVFPKQTGPTGQPTASNLPQPPPPSTSPPLSATIPLSQMPSAPPRQTPSAPLPKTPAAAPPPVHATPPKKKSKLPLILGVLALLFVFGVSAIAAGLYFFVIKPRREALQAEPPVVEKTNQNENANDNANTANTNSEPAKTEEKTATEFVAPPNTTRFTNSQANLDGKLAEHYLDFSFYYPNNWAADPKAGVAGASNFAKVERRLRDITQENFAVGWYTSKGTFAADESTFPQLVEVLGASLANNFPGYRKVSEGPTKVNSLDGYEFRFVSASKESENSDIQVWGRVIFLPTGVSGEQTGATLVMLATSLAPELSGVEDVGEKGQMPVILASFRFGKP